MRVSQVTLQLAQMISQSISDAGLAPVGEVGIYHGTPPDDCCPAPGDPARVIGWWQLVGAPPPQGKAPTIGKVSGCAPLTLAEISVVMKACWPVPQTSEEAVAAPLDLFEPTAVYLADCAEVGWLALTGWLCERSFQRDPSQLMTAAHLMPVVPVAPQGGCAGVRWGVTVELRPPLP